MYFSFISVLESSCIVFQDLFANLPCSGLGRSDSDSRGVN